jgi:hypothetical protein
LLAHKKNLALVIRAFVFYTQQILLLTNFKTMGTHFRSNAPSKILSKLARIYSRPWFLLVALVTLANSDWLSSSRHAKWLAIPADWLRYDWLLLSNITINYSATEPLPVIYGIISLLEYFCMFGLVSTSFHLWNWRDVIFRRWKRC